MTKDLTAEEAQDRAWKHSGALVLEEGAEFVVYRTVQEGGKSVPAVDGFATHRVTKKEIGRGKTRREALERAGIK